MAWIGLADHHDGRFCPHGLGTDRRAELQVAASASEPLVRGSLVFETRLSPDGRPQKLFGFSGQQRTDATGLMFQAIPGGGISMVQTCGMRVTHAAIQRMTTGRTDILRITLSWDNARGWARLALEEPEEHNVTSVVINDLQPLMLDDLRATLLAQNNRVMASDVLFAALSTDIEPIGPSPSMAANVPVATPDGYRPAGTLRRGDCVLTESSGVVPVLHRIDRVVPARGSFHPIRLRAPYFGLKHDITVSPDQRLVIRGSEVEYLFGQEAVLVPARHLMNGHAAFDAQCGPVVTYTQLLLPGHETVLAAGTWAESLYIGRLRRKPDQLASSALGHLDRASLPEHGKPAFPVLKWFEAVTLAQQRAA